MEDFEGKTRIQELIRENNRGPSSLVQVLTIIQEEHGYLPQEVQMLVSEELKVPLSRVYEVTSFYSRFTTEQKGRYEISVCLGTACYIKGATRIYDELKKLLNIEENETTPDNRFTLTASRCIGACALAPAITINKDVHGMMTVEDLTEVLEMYK